jgi:ABC-2 type transport system permease protein
VGIILASVVLVFKKGDAVFNALGGLGLVVSGLVFPTEALPPLMKELASFIPTTYSLHGLRLAVLKGHSLDSLQGDVMGLLAFAVCFLAVGVWAFPFALKKAKISGSLTQY